MSSQNTIKDGARLIYYLSQNTISLIGVVLTTSSAITLNRLLDIRLHAAGASASVCWYFAFPDSPSTVFVRSDLHPDWHFLPASQVARGRRTAHYVPRNRHENAGGPQRPSVRWSRNLSECHDFRFCLLSGSRIHGHRFVLRTVVSHTDGSRVQRLSKCSTFAGRLCGVPHRSRGGLVCPRTISASSATGRNVPRGKNSW